METVHPFIFDSLSDWKTGFASAWICSPDMNLPQNRLTVEKVAEISDPHCMAGG